MAESGEQCVQETILELQAALTQTKPSTLTGQIHRLLAGVASRSEVQDLYRRGSVNAGELQETHPASLLLALLKLPDGNQIDEPQRGLGSIIRNEMQSPRYYESIVFINNQLHSEVERLAEEAPDPSSADWSRRIAGYQHQLRQKQEQWVRHELSWFLESVVRYYARKKLRFDAAWNDATGRSLNLAAVAAAQERFLEISREFPRAPIATEHGVHVLMAHGTLVHYFLEDPSAGELLPHYQERVERMLQGLLSYCEERRSRLTYVDYLIIAHLLEYVVAPDTYKPRLRSGSTGDMSSKVNEFVEWATPALTRYIKVTGADRLGIPLAAHALIALEMIEQSRLGGEDGGAGERY